MLFGTIELLTRRRRTSREASRRAAHILAGLATAALPAILSFPEIMVLATIFVVLLAASRRFGVLTPLAACLLGWALT